MEVDRGHGEELPNCERGIPEGSREMQEKAQRTHRRETLRSYHASISVRVSLSSSMHTYV
jgi:hypothetical protein